MLEKELIKKFEEGINFFNDKDSKYIIFEETESVKDETGHELNGKIMPNIWNNETAEETAEKWYYWYLNQITGKAIPKNGKIIITKLTKWNKYFGQLQPEDKPFIIEW